MVIKHVANVRVLGVAAGACLALYVGTSSAGAEPVAPGSRVIVRQDQTLFATKDEATRPAVVVARPGNEAMSLAVVADHGDVVEVRTDGSNDDCVPGYRGLGGYTGHAVVRAFVAKRDLLPRLRANQVTMFDDHTGYALTAGSPMVARQGGFMVAGLDALPPPFFGSNAVALGIVPRGTVATMPDRGQPMVCSRESVMTQAQALEEQQRAAAARLQECKRVRAAKAPPPSTTVKKNSKKSQGAISDEQAETFENFFMADDTCEQGAMSAQLRRADGGTQACGLPSVLRVGGVAVLTFPTADDALGQRPTQRDNIITADYRMSCATLRVVLEPAAKSPVSSGGLATIGSGYGRASAPPPYEAWGAFTWPDGKAAGKVEGKGRLVLPAAFVQLQGAALCTHLPNLSQPICFAKKNFRQLVGR